MKTLACVIFLGCLVSASGGEPLTNVDARAEQVLRSACQFLAEAPYFGLTAEIWREHVNSNGEKLQFSRTMEMEVKRPDRLHVEIDSPHTQRGFWLNGKSLSVLDGKHEVYSTAKVSGALDRELDAAREQFGIDLPMIDLAVSDPFQNAMARVQTGRYFGLAPAMGFSCYHLAFTQDNIDWQVWVQAGPQPLIRKFIITHKNEPGSPEFTGLIREWDFTSRISDADFVFEPPPGAVRVQMHGATQQENSVPRPTGPAQPRGR